MSALSNSKWMSPSRPIFSMRSVAVSRSVSYSLFGGTVSGGGWGAGGGVAGATGGGSGALGGGGFLYPARPTPTASATTGANCLMLTPLSLCCRRLLPRGEERALLARRRSGLLLVLPTTLHSALEVADALSQPASQLGDAAGAEDEHQQQKD